jgi:hypothetical protein
MKIFTQWKHLKIFKGINSRVIYSFVLVISSTLTGCDKPTYECSTDFSDHEVEEKITASDAALNDKFGNSVSIYCDAAIVGAQSDDSSTGSAYIYRYNGAHWIEEQKLTASDGVGNDNFGGSVAIRDTAAAIGAFGVESYAGSVYIFRYNVTLDSWEQEAKLTAPDGQSGDRFGHAVSISDGVVVVAAPYHDESANNDGAAYVYRHDGTDWILEQKLIASDQSINDQFGYSTSISGDVIVVGAHYGDADGIVSAGKAYVYRYSGEDTTWVEEQILYASDAAMIDHFGRAVSNYQDTIVIGTPDYDVTDANEGAAYIFRYNGSSWSEEALLTASNGEEYDGFGNSVSIFEDKVAVGAPAYWTVVDDPGSTYIYTFDGSVWGEEREITASDAAINDMFGYSISLKGDILLVGSYYDDATYMNSGSVYFYNLVK